MIHSILFTGHMIDAPGRKEPRFPPAKEGVVKDHIGSILNEERKQHAQVTGIAGGACGGDILFHETCLEASIPGEIFLPLPVPEFKKKSVLFAGEDWGRRFDRLLTTLPVTILDLNKDENMWEKANLWMLDEALQKGQDITLIALWDGNKGDGPGGTFQMIQVAESRGVAIRIIAINKL